MRKFLRRRSFASRSTVALLATVAYALAPLSAAFAQPALRTVSIAQFVEHPELDNIRRGVMDALVKSGFDSTHARVVFESAQGDYATGVQIAQKFAGMKSDVIVTIGSPMGQAAVRSGVGVPIVFCGVADPLGAGLVTNAAHPGGRVTGVRSFTPIEPQLDLIHKITPQVHRIGILANPAENNSHSVVLAIQNIGAKRGYSFVVQDVMSSSEISSAAANLVGKVDAFYVPTDNTVVSGIDAVIKVARANKIPLFTGETSSVRRGGFASAGLDWYQTGVDAGGLVARILRGEKPGEIPVLNQTGGVNTVVNSRTASEIGIALPVDLAAKGAHLVSQ